MKRLYQLVTETQFNRCIRPKLYRKLLYSLCFFHSVLLERKKFRQMGWNIIYGFNDSDFEVRKFFLQGVYVLLTLTFCLGRIFTNFFLQHYVGLRHPLIIFWSSPLMNCVHLSQLWVHLSKEHCSLILLVHSDVTLGI